MISVEYEWLNQHRKECFKYRGEYIAVVGTRVIAHDRDLRELVAKTEHLPEIPHIRLVPDTVDNEIADNFDFPSSADDADEA